MKISLILAMDRNGGIGNKQDLPWPRIKEDMRFFRDTTLGHCVIMGRKTYQSLPMDGLPKRTNVVLTRLKGFRSSNVHVLESAPDVYKFVSDNFPEAFVIGGKEIYDLFVELAQQVYVTHIDNQYLTDTNVDIGAWGITPFEDSPDWTAEKIWEGVTDDSVPYCRYLYTRRQQDLPLTGG